MKIPARFEIEDYTKAIGVGAAKGAFVGAIISTGLFTIMTKKTTFFRTAGGFPKSLTVAGPILFSAGTGMEISSREFEEHTRERLKGNIPETKQHKSVSLWNSVTKTVGDNKYGFIVGGWAVAMATSWHIVNRDKYMTRSQKLVQARVYAQGLTVVMLLASVFLSVSNPEQERKERAERERSSWVVHSHNPEVNASNRA